MTKPFLAPGVYRLLFILLGLVYVIGLFVPLMDNDSAHHASIALRMHLTGNYAFLVDQRGAYLDKPHLLFWLVAASYKIFGVTDFAYRFPSLLFTIGGIYSVFRLGKLLYDTETGKLAALIMTSALAFILANNDVRMDAILTACIAFSCWQLAAFVQKPEWKYVIGSALGLALGFMTKGHIALFVPGAFTFFYILYLGSWSVFLNARWVIMLLLFGLFIAPVVYAYYLQYNLHPETVVRGRDHINGVTFILFNQSIERFSGGMGGDAKNDYLFFLHSFLWAFAPWSLLTYIATGRRIRYFLQRREEWGTTGAFLLVAIVVSLSGFKLPHYLNIVFPLAAIITAHYVLSLPRETKWVYVLQAIIAFLVIALAGFINVWAFPVHSAWIIAGTVLLLALVFYFTRSRFYNAEQKAVAISVAAMIFGFFLLNSNFYPKLLTYQAGETLAVATKGKVDPATVYNMPNNFSASYIVYSKSKFQPFSDSLLQSGQKVWLITEPGHREELQKQGYHFGVTWSATHFRVTKLSLKFLNPATRDKECSQMMITEITGKNRLTDDRH